MKLLPVFLTAKHFSFKFSLQNTEKVEKQTSGGAARRAVALKRSSSKILVHISSMSRTK